MKRNYIWLVALLLVALAACIAYMASSSNDTACGNTERQASVTVTWPENIRGEAFTVMTNRAVEVNEDADDAKHLFTPTTGEAFTGTLPAKEDGEVYYAFCPAIDLYREFTEGEGDYIHWDIDGNPVQTFATYKVPFDISEQDGTLNGKENLMYAVSKDGKDFRVQQLTAVVKLTLTHLPASVGHATISIGWEGGCCSWGIIDLTEESVEAKYPQAQDEQVCTVKVYATAQNGTVTCHAYLPPVAVGKTLSIRCTPTTPGKYEYTQSVVLTKALEAGQHYDMSYPMEQQKL